MFVRPGAASFLAGALLVAIGPPVARADDVTTTYFEQLRQRRLFVVAEDYCADRLATADLSESRRAGLTLELARTLAEHARYSSGEDSVELFNRAEKTLDDFLAAHPRTPLRLSLDVERAMIPAKRGEFLRWQVELFPHDEQLRSRAQEKLADALRRLGAVEKSLTDPTHREPGTKGDGEGALSPAQLKSLSNSVRYQLGAAEVERAKLYPRTSGERAAALLQADEWLRRLTTGPAGDELTWQSQLRLAESTRLSGDFKQAAAMLAAVERDSPSPAAAEQVVVQRAQLHLDEGRANEALRVLDEFDHMHPVLSGESQFLKVLALAGLWKAAFSKPDRPRADELFRQLEAQAAVAERELGGYWGYRCRLLLNEMQQTALYGEELAGVIAAARGALSAGNVDRALSEYARGEALAEQSRRAETAQELGYARGTILVDAGRYEEAAQTFHSLAARYPNQPRAADSHLFWAWCLGKLYEKARTDDRRKLFAEALAAHRAQFAGHGTHADATWMLAELEERGGEYQRALQLYAEIPAEHARGAEAQAAAARCYESILDELRAQNRPREAWEAQAIDRLERMAASLPAAPDALSLPQSELSLRLARIRLRQARPDYLRADRLLERVFSSAPADQPAKKEASSDAAERWKALVTQATQLRIVSLAGQKRLPEAEALVQHLSHARPAEVLDVLDGLTVVAEAADAPTQRELGELQLRAAGEIAGRRKALDAAESQKLDRCLAQAYLATGQPTRAIEVYEALLDSHPRDRELLRTVARLLSECGTAPCVEKSLVYWRRIVAQEKQGSPEWLAGSYSVAWCCLQLKQYEECGKILGVTRVLYPDLGGPELRAKFEALQRALDKARGAASSSN